MKNFDLKKESIKGFLWRVIQNVSSQLIYLIIQIILARILLPSDFGIISLTTVFVTILNVFVTTGFTSSIIQKKIITDIEKSSMFYMSIIIGLLLYILIFLLSPFIAQFYKEKLLIKILRIQSISLIFSSLSSVSLAIITRNLEFKKSFIASIIGYLFQGFIGIYMALSGYGIWTLVISSLTYNIIFSILIIIITKWHPKSLFSIKSILDMLSFSSKVLGINLINAIYNSSQSLIIGKAFNSEFLGFYNKGVQFPSTIMSSVDGALTTVLFSSLSKIQDDKERFVSYLRQSMKISLTVVVPMMCGLAAISKPFIIFLLTEKWSNSIPFLMIYSVVCMFWPLSAKLHALNAIGKSGVTLIIESVIKVISLFIMFLSIKFGIYIFALSSIITVITSNIIRAIIISHYFNYSFKQQVIDVTPVYAIGISMFCLVYSLSIIININIFLQLIILIFIGSIYYIIVSLLFKTEGFMFIVDTISTFLKTKKVRSDISE